VLYDRRCCESRNPQPLDHAKSFHHPLGDPVSKLVWRQCAVRTTTYTIFSIRIPQAQAARGDRNADWDRERQDNLPLDGRRHRHRPLADNDLFANVRDRPRTATATSIDGIGDKYHEADHHNELHHNLHFSPLLVPLLVPLPAVSSAASA
jgi:hypothetical protein